MYSFTIGQRHPCKLEPWFSHANLSSAIAFNQFVLLLSRDTLKISKPLAWYFAYALTKLGFSIRQGRHQDAQKSTNTTLPFKELNSISFPSALGITMDGGIFPISMGLFNFEGMMVSMTEKS